MSSSEWVVGFHAVVGALERQADRVELVLVGEGAGSGRVRRVRDLARAAGVRVRDAVRRELDEAAAGVAHNGVAARLAPIAYADPGRLLELPSPVCLLCLDNLADGHNLGAAVRVAAAFALGGVVVSGPHPPPLGGAAAKVAAGTLALVPVAHVPSLGDFARQARDAGFWALGASRDGTPAPKLDWPERLLLCVGAEQGGLRAKTQRAMDGAVGIPIAAAVESLNLSVAAGILAWEWRRAFPTP